MMNIIIILAELWKNAMQAAIFISNRINNLGVISMREVYHEKIMEHFHNSPYRGRLENPDFITDETSPSCGDRIIFTGKCDNNRLIGVKFEGEGSIIGQVAASMLCEKVQGLDCDAIFELTTDDIVQLLGIKLGPNRLRTIAFVLQAFQKGVASYLSTKTRRGI
jgi:nitrogen fixation protein NifU and related proteins